MTNRNYGRRDWVVVLLLLLLLLHTHTHTLTGKDAAANTFLCSVPEGGAAEVCLFMPSSPPSVYFSHKHGGEMINGGREKGGKRRSYGGGFSLPL